MSCPLTEKADFCLRTIMFQRLLAGLSIYNEVLAGRGEGNHPIKYSLHSIYFGLRIKNSHISYLRIIYSIYI